MLRSFLIKASLITGLIILCLMTSAVTLAVAAPFHPGNVFFPLQSFSEQQVSIIFLDPVRLADYGLDLLERRINDLGMLAGSKSERVALGYLDTALNQATLAMADVPQEAPGNNLRSRLLTLLQTAAEKMKLLSVVPKENPQLYASFNSKLQTLRSMVEAPGVANSALSAITRMPIDTALQPGSAVPMAAGAGGLIPWPAGSSGAQHAFFPLIGQHAILLCNTCHNAGKYLGMPDTCAQCHAQEIPKAHYTGNCISCHTSVSWADVTFDHAVAAANDCQACHADKAPGNHYTGQCSTCHNTTDWKLVSFNHDAQGAVDCANCHTKNVPANHYAGQCSTCHDTNNWASARIDHSPGSNCLTCHQSDKPANHYAGVCSNCHSTQSWSGATPTHEGQTDCASCHAKDAPAGHYAGQCSNCHSAGAGWKNYNFNHSGFTDCRSCHVGDTPANHYSGQCRAATTRRPAGKMPLLIIPVRRTARAAMPVTHLPAITRGSVLAATTRKAVGQTRTLTTAG